MSKYPHLRSVGLRYGYVNKSSDDGDHPHKHLGQAMVGDPDITDGRVIILTRDEDGNIAITNFRKHDEHSLQDFVVEHITNPEDIVWGLLNESLNTAIHPGNHGYADDSNFMVQDHNLVRAHEAEQLQRWEQKMTAPVTDTENFLIQARAVNNDTKASEVLDLVHETLSNHFNGDVKNTRVFIATEMNDGAVHVSHISSTNNLTRSDSQDFMFTSGASMYEKMAAGFDNALDNISNGYSQSLE